MHCLNLLSAEKTTGSTKNLKSQDVLPRWGLAKFTIVRKSVVARSTLRSKKTMLSSFILRFLEWGLFALLWGALVLRSRKTFGN